MQSEPVNKEKVFFEATGITRLRFVRPGDRVRHKEYGTGTVLTIRCPRVWVIFDSDESRVGHIVRPEEIAPI